jgi:chemotaxis protein MotA
MDFATLAGLFIGLTVVGSAILTGSDFNIFLNLPGILIVMGGTFAATMIKFPMAGFLSSLPVGIKAAFTNDRTNPREFIKQSIAMSKRARKSGLVSLDGVKLKNQFFAKGVQLCADGRDLDYIRMILTREMARTIQQEEQSAKVYAAIGDAAPAFGMFGTLVGLVQMLANMNDPTTIGPAMAVAMLTTLYGVLIANLIALPIADKLEAKTEIQKATRGLIIECVFQIQQMTNPTEMEEVLEPFLPEKRRPSGGKGSYTGSKKGRK